MIKIERLINSKFNTSSRSIYVLILLLLEANRMLTNRMLTRQIVLEIVFAETRLHEMIC